METIILCGGKGTRIRSASDNMPKPMLNIGQWPILWHIMKIYATYRYTDFILALGYRSWTIKEFFLNYHAMRSDFTLTLCGDPAVEYHNGHQECGWKITFAETGLDSLTGARIKQAAQYVKDDYFMVTYGDGLADINIDELVAFHKSHGKLATVTGVTPPGRFGNLKVNGNNVTSFTEKPADGGGLINGGFLVFNREVIDLMPGDQFLSLEGDFMEGLAADGQLRMYHHPGFWQPMDTYREYTHFNELWEAGDAPWKIWD